MPLVIGTTVNGVPRDTLPTNSGIPILMVMFKAGWVFGKSAMVVDCARLEARRETNTDFQLCNDQRVTGSCSHTHIYISKHTLCC